MIAYARTRPATGAWNMALDELLLEMIDAGTAPFRLVLRTFEWSPGCVSFGRLQDPGRELDLRRLLEAGTDVVRRPTGGRAVWHEHEVTYSIVAARGHPFLGASLGESLDRISAPLVEALRGLGLDAFAGRTPDTSAPRGSRGAPSSPCFASHGRSEVMIGGRKVVGSAQARTQRGFLEHGSVLLVNDQPGLADYLPAGSPSSMREAFRASLERGVAGIREHRPATTAEEVHTSLRGSFERALAEPFRELDLNALLTPAFRDRVREKQRLAAAALSPAAGSP
ncbi:lipoate--protein ligase family protein [Candidatus Fermentibacterales bacterium]|nr:lipoate--protein ligase family protein [Candidatus Fermentibacterales bacterium]